MSVSPLTLAGPTGPLFAIHVTPDDTSEKRREAVLYLPPFAEEMNRSRRMASLLARNLAGEGFGALILDLFGTGDSAGNFEDASWDIWCGDARAACVWLAEQGYKKISLVGLRLGACLALETARAADLQNLLAQIVLWQPVTKGETFLNQFLRIRLAAGLGQDINGADRETVKGLRAILLEGSALEVAGYQLTSSLAAAIADLDMVDLVDACDRPLTWIELGSGPDLSPASARIIENLSNSGMDVNTRIVAGEPFWSIEEPILVPALWQETASVLAGL